ncbi:MULTISPECIES: hypothetical protein [Burkholderia]|uniref:hypothetical protein n=1 Tax=Burkholderia TaxID=32008 RepID=UPI00265D8A38|nr:hypothetical protein [Burkholderia sp. AU44665]MDN7701352.1 hypothetical protein [Burkholderia sp. AU44665]
MSASLLARRDGPDTIACDGSIRCFVAAVRWHDGAKTPEILYLDKIESPDISNTRKNNRLNFRTITKNGCKNYP